MKKIKLVTLVMLTTCLIGLTPKKAEAGVFIGYTGFALGHEYGQYQASPYLWALPGASIAGMGVWVLRVSKVGGSLLIVLDETSQTQKKLEMALAHEYYFINNPEVIHNLATMINLKLPSTLVTLTETEVRTALAAVDLSEEEVQFVVNDLSNF